MHKITIDPALNGYICRVGCQTVVFESATKLIEELSRYLAQPRETVERYLRDAVNPSVAVPQTAPEQVDRPAGYTLAGAQTGRGGTAAPGSF